MLQSLAKSLPPPVARAAKRIGVYPRYYRQALACRAGYRAHGTRYPHPVLFVAGLPKSGTTWLKRMLASYPGFHELLIPDVAAYELHTGGSHDYDLPDDTFRRFDRMLVLSKMHVHGSPHNAALLRAAGVPYVVMYRDLRDVAVSHYFYVRQTPWHPEHPFYARLALPEALIAFAQRTAPAYAGWLRLWQANRDPALSLVLRYEDLLADTHAELTRVADHFGLDSSPATIAAVVAQHSFSRLSGGRTAGQSDAGSFFRKGVAGDWRNHFTPELNALYQEIVGPEPVEFGYELGDAAATAVSVPPPPVIQAPPQKTAPDGPHTALICQHFYPEMLSTGKLLTELAVGLAEQGHNLRVYCARPAYLDQANTEETPRRLTYRGVPVLRVRTLGDPRGGLLTRGLFALTYVLTTLRAVWRERCCLEGIIATTNPPFIGLVAVLMHWLTGVRYVTIVHDVYPDVAVRLGALPSRSPLTWLWQQTTGVIFNHSSRLIVLGRDMAQVVAAKLREPADERIALVPNWSDESRVRPVPPDENEFARAQGMHGRFVIQYAGRMGRTHNLEPLIEAADLLRDQPVLFQIIGDGPKRARLEVLAKARGLTNVQFLPYQPYERLDEVLSAADVAVACLDVRFTGLSVPSKTYGIMASGRPILGFFDPDSEIARVIKENDCGVVLENPDGAQVAQVVTQLMAKPEWSARMGRNGRDAFLRHYTLSHAVQQYSSILHQAFTPDESMQTIQAATSHASRSS